MLLFGEGERTIPAEFDSLSLNFNNFFLCQYDVSSPYINRFIQPDTLIPDPSNSQSWNRFGYVVGNPILHNDPTGHTYNPPCWFCNTVLWDYSSLPVEIIIRLDNSSAINFGCFIVGCRVDKDAHAVKGPTETEYMSRAIPGPMVDVQFSPPIPYSSITPENGSINPKFVYYSQNDAGQTFKDGRKWIDLANGLKDETINPSNVPPIRIFNDANGKIWTLDNRRLAAFEYAEVDVPYISATAKEIENELWKFTTNNGGTSILIRGINHVVAK